MKNYLIILILIPFISFSQTYEWQLSASKIYEESFGDAQEQTSLSDDGSVIVIGAQHNNGNGTYSGHVRVFENISSVWTQIGSDIDGEASFDEFGSSVSISSDGSIIAAGAIYNDGNGNNSGHVRVYENISGVWNQIGDDINGEASNDEFGSAVSLSSNGNIVAIGATKNDEGANNSGHVRVYENVSGVWTQVGNDIDGEYNRESLSD